MTYSPVINQIGDMRKDSGAFRLGTGYAGYRNLGLSRGVIHTSHLQEVAHMDDDGTWNFNRCDYWQPGWSSTMSFINKTGLSLELVVKADGMVRF